MKLPVTVYRWDDAGAPQIVGRKPSEIIDILRKCLVDGYGTKQPLGWTIEHEDAAAFKIMFRNSVTDGGSGHLVRYHAATGDTNGAMMRVQSCVSATDIDTLVNAGYDSAMQLYDGTMTKWYVIGTSRGYIMGIPRTNSKMGLRRGAPESVHIAGDVNVYSPVDKAFIATGTPTYTGDFDRTSLASYSYAFAKITARRGVTGGVAAVKLPSVHGDGLLQNYGFADNYHTYEEYDRNVPLDKKGLYVPITVACSTSFTSYGTLDPDGASLIYSSRYPWARGEVAGIVTEVMHRYESLPHSSWPLIEEHGGQLHWALCSAGVNISTWVNMVEWEYNA